MAFNLHTDDKGAVAPLEYLPASAGDYTVGLALTMTSGKLAKATGTTKPSYICGCEGTIAAGASIPVMRVGEDQVWETTFAASAASINLGDKVTIHTDAAQVTATTTSGVAEVVAMDGTDSGSTCWVRF